MWSSATRAYLHTKKVSLKKSAFKKERFFWSDHTELERYEKIVGWLHHCPAANQRIRFLFPGTLSALVVVPPAPRRLAAGESTVERFFLFGKRSAASVHSSDVDTDTRTIQQRLRFDHPSNYESPACSISGMYVPPWFLHFLSASWPRCPLLPQVIPFKMNAVLSFKSTNPLKSFYSMIADLCSK